MKKIGTILGLLIILGFLSTFVGGVEYVYGNPDHDSNYYDIARTTKEECLEWWNDVGYTQYYSLDQWTDGWAYDWWCTKWDAANDQWIPYGGSYDACSYYKPPHRQYEYIGCTAYGKLVTNQAPTITSVSDSPDPQKGNSAVGFSSTASDPDSGDTIKLYICKDSACTSCGPSSTTNCWAVSSVGSTTNPTASYTCPSCNYAVNNYWAKVCDASNVCSSIISGGSFTCKKENGCSETNSGNCYSGYAVDGYCCNSACTGSCQTCAATPGTCTTRSADDNTECGTCNRCDGTNTNCVVVASGQEGKNCTTACKQCNGASGCVDINNAEDTTGSNTCSGACKYCSAGACTTVTCGEETYGTTCSGSSVCDNAGTCVAKASNGNACKVGTCTTCSPATSCTFCASGYCQAGGICGATSTTKTMCAYSTASGGGVVSAGESISPSDPYVASARGWSIPNYGSVNFPSYLELQTMYGYDNATTITNLSVVAGNGVYRVTASDGLTIAAGDSPPCDLGFSAVIFVDHDLTISRSFTNDTVTGNPLDYKNGCNSSLAFIVSGDINIAQTVNNIYGIFYAGGSIKTNE